MGGHAALVFRARILPLRPDQYEVPTVVTWGPRGANTTAISSGMKRLFIGAVVAVLLLTAGIVAWAAWASAKVVARLVRNL